MAENSKIEWTDHTFNPWMGCTRVSEGCRYCYAETLMDHRWNKVQWGPQGERVRTSDAIWRQPIKWNERAMREGRRFRVFCASLADVFEDKAELKPWRDELFALMAYTTDLDWQVLTKRPENVACMVPPVWMVRWPDHVWMGTSVENQETADKRIPELLRIPAAIRFLSCEPLLGPIDFHKVPGFNRVGLNLRGWWVIAGGESGPNARPMHPDWARSLRDQCQVAGVPFFFKQWGEWTLKDTVEATSHDFGVLSPSGEWYHQHTGWNGRAIDPDTGEAYMVRVGKKVAGRLLDGREWSEFPQSAVMA